jgi:hypothetical protein
MGDKLPVYICKQHNQLGIWVGAGVSTSCLPESKTGHGNRSSYLHTFPMCFSQLAERWLKIHLCQIRLSWRPKPCKYEGAFQIGRSHDSFSFVIQEQECTAVY